MSYHDPELLSARNRLSAYKQHRAPGDPKITEAEKAFGAELIAARIREVVDSFPPLTEDQRCRIAALLGPAVRDIASARRAAPSAGGGDAA